MKDPRNYLIGLLGAALLAAGALLLRERSRAAELREHLRAAKEAPPADNAKDAADKAEQRAGAGDARIRELESQLAEARRAAAEIKATQATAPAAASRGAPPTDTKAWLASATNADNLKAQAARIRLRMDERYGPFAQRLGLNADQTDQFMQLLVDRQMVTNDAIVASLQEGDNALKDPLAFATLLADARGEVESQLQALLGPDGYSQFLQTQLAANQSRTLARLQATLAGTEPLNDAQSAQLQQLLSDNRIGHLTPKIMATAQLQGFLSPAQMQALQNLFQEQQAAMQSRRVAPPPPDAGGK
ncbi:MAG TPA: hypothetical protein VLW52_03360 [Opitutaceae bacterium]|nr:hypothetical protein [Opitutaceae bacterium]